MIGVEERAVDGVDAGRGGAARGRDVLPDVGGRSAATPRSSPLPRTSTASSSAVVVEIAPQRRAHVRHRGERMAPARRPTPRPCARSTTLAARVPAPATKRSSAPSPSRSATLMAGTRPAAGASARSTTSRSNGAAPGARRRRGRRVDEHRLGQRAHARVLELRHPRARIGVERLEDVERGRGLGCAAAALQRLEGAVRWRS